MICNACNTQGRSPGLRHEVAGGGVGGGERKDGKKMEIRKRLDDF